MAPDYRLSHELLGVEHWWACAKTWRRDWLLAMALLAHRQRLALPLEQP
ncbi:hypothetical protein [Mumia zhuanghuii]|nr:hypothetical protein [Mumia zhuanghuii]